MYFLFRRRFFLHIKKEKRKVSKHCTRLPILAILSAPCRKPISYLLALKATRNMLGSFRKPSQSANKVSNSPYLLFYFILFLLVWFRENEEKDRIFRIFSSFSVERSFLVYGRTIEICNYLEIQFISF